MRVSQNTDFYNTIDGLRYPDWAVVVLFYKSVHMIESILAERGDHSGDHAERKRFMKKHRDLFSEDIIVNYRDLETLSRQARYQPNLPISRTNVCTAEACYTTIEKLYASHRAVLASR